MYEIFRNHIGKLCLDWRNKGSLENFSPSSNSQLVTDVYTSFSFKIQAQWRLPEVELSYLVANLRVPIYWSILASPTWHAYPLRARCRHSRFMREVIFRECETRCITNLILCHFCGPSWGYIESWRTRIRFGGKLDSQSNFDVTARFRENPARLKFMSKL